VIRLPEHSGFCLGPHHHLQLVAQVQIVDQAVEDVTVEAIFARGDLRDDVIVVSHLNEWE
jgi:hypothetical protein